MAKKTISKQTDMELLDRDYEIGKKELDKQKKVTLAEWAMIVHLFERVHEGSKLQDDIDNAILNSMERLGKAVKGLEKRIVKLERQA